MAASPARLAVCCTFAALAARARRQRWGAATVAELHGADAWRVGEKALRQPAVGDELVRRIRAALSEDLARHVLDLVSFRWQRASSIEHASVTLLGASGSRLALLGHEADVRGIQFFRLGDRVLTWSADGVAIVWDTASGEALASLLPDEGVEMARIFPQGDRVLTCSDYACTVWSARSGKALSALGTEGISDVEVFPTGHLAMTWWLSVASVWDARTGRRLCSFRGHTKGINVAKVFPGGDRAVTAGSDGKAIIWSASSCETIHELAHDTWVLSVAVARSGDFVVTVTRAGVATVWSAGSGAEILTLADLDAGGLDFAHVVQPFPLDDRMLTFNPGVAVVWNATSGAVLRRFVSVHGIRAATLSPAGDVLALCGRGQLSVWDPTSGARLQAFLDEGSFDRPWAGIPDLCVVATGLGRAIDPHGFGHGLPLQELRGPI